MPLFKETTPESGASLGVWKITESAGQLFSGISENEQQQLLSARGRNEQALLQKAAVRVLLKYLVEKTGDTYKGVYYDQHGKPHLCNSSREISVSHSGQYAVAILHDNKTVGVDIERVRDKILLIQDKFLHLSEIPEQRQNTEELTKFWSGKESVYKMNGRSAVSFKRDILLKPVTEKNRFKAYLYQEEFSEVSYIHVDNYIVAYCF